MISWRSCSEELEGRNRFVVADIAVFSLRTTITTICTTMIYHACIYINISSIHVAL